MPEQANNNDLTRKTAQVLGLSLNQVETARLSKAQLQETFQKATNDHKRAKFMAVLFCAAALSLAVSELTIVATGNHPSDHKKMTEICGDSLGVLAFSIMAGSFFDRRKHLKSSIEAKSGANLLHDYEAGKIKNNSQQNLQP